MLVVTSRPDHFRIRAKRGRQMETGSSSPPLSWSSRPCCSCLTLLQPSGFATGAGSPGAGSCSAPLPLASRDAPSDRGSAGFPEVAFGDGRLWFLTNAGEAQPGRVDPLVLTVVGSPILVGRGSASGWRPLMAASEGAVWVRNQHEGTVSRIDTQMNQVVATIPVEHGRRLGNNPRSRSEHRQHEARVSEPGDQENGHDIDNRVGGAVDHR
jgi:YVTN family beta-propeller protein